MLLGVAPLCNTPHASALCVRNPVPRWFCQVGPCCQSYSAALDSPSAWYQSSGHSSWSWPLRPHEADGNRRWTSLRGPSSPWSSDSAAQRWCQADARKPWPCVLAVPNGQVLKKCLYRIIQRDLLWLHILRNLRLGDWREGWGTFSNNCHLFLNKCHLFFNNQLLFSNKVPLILNTRHLLSDKLQRPGESVLADCESAYFGLPVRRRRTHRLKPSYYQRNGFSLSAKRLLATRETASHSYYWYLWTERRHS